MIYFSGMYTARKAKYTEHSNAWRIHGNHTAYAFLEIARAVYEPGGASLP
jgi:hypothetical protein